MDKLDPLTLLEDLINSGKAEIQDGVFLVSEEKMIKPVIYGKNSEVVIDFDAPFVYLHVTKLGPKRLVNLVNPRVEHIVIKKTSIEVKISTLGTWEFER